MAKSKSNVKVDCDYIRTGAGILKIIESIFLLVIAILGFIAWDFDIRSFYSFAIICLLIINLIFILANLCDKQNIGCEFLFCISCSLALWGLCAWWTYLNYEAMTREALITNQTTIDQREVPVIGLIIVSLTFVCSILFIIDTCILNKYR